MSLSSSKFSNSNSSVSIAVSDDESDGVSRTHARARRKRKKQHGQQSRSLSVWLRRMLLKYWMVLVLISASGLLVFEASRIVKRPDLEPKSEVELGLNVTVKAAKKSEGNLNRLDPVTRVVGGIRERCLKLQSPEELEHLDIPTLDEPSSPVKSVVYISAKDAQGMGGTADLSEKRTEATRFNLFTGFQSLDQRDKSFQVNETAKVHCGFYDENGGFRISDEDKSYMETCKVVVSTCAFGGGDDLYQPIGMSSASLQKVCYVAFWDEITLAAQEAEGHIIGEDHFIGRWRVVIVRDLPFTDQRLNGKIPKMLGHRLFPHAKYSIWVDSKSQFRRDPLGVLEALLWGSNSVLAISEHGARSNVYDEANAVVKKHKASPEEVEVQLAQYRRDGLPKNKKFNGKKALSEASVIVRQHTPMTNLLMCLWFNEVVRFTSRDQLSFPYVLWRLKVVSNINMFPVCVRKDLVNSMGHRRKARPLAG
ncbi:hypothetical protein K2173_014294 [Erythroxylum novogranatense]|uniref:TOD1/MUCI70 glycosyltransferase-like domain-containing protein n=1 Tax=Erythroxylum novogranatense TaxID=1862640 RepID=A0AAV8SEE7_9ROSI|nr:hypothetical protein K2173_014294 [Erythroxylum novogranatense]